MVVYDDSRTVLRSMSNVEAFEDAGHGANSRLMLHYLRARPRAQSYMARMSIHHILGIVFCGKKKLHVQ